MPKLDKTLLTKQEFKQKLAERRKKKQKTITISEPNKIDIPPIPQYNILCLKHGTKYDYNYVNILYNMVKNNTRLPYNFFCITEDTSNLNENIITIPLPKINKASGWWFKPYIFSNELPITGTILYLDLDIVITNNIDRLLTYYPNKYCIVRDFTRVMRPSWEKYNSSVIKFEKGSLNFVWEKFQKHHNEIIRKYFGDQDYLYEETKDTAVYFPDKWILSWKWEVRKNKMFATGSTKGNRKFAVVEDIKPPDDCCITVFHGDPNPHNCEDPYIIEKWK